MVAPREDFAIISAAHQHRAEVSEHLNERPRKRRRLSISSQVIIKVQDDEGIIHQYPVQEHCLKLLDFFKACLKDGWPESRTRVIDLKEIDYLYFEVYLQWLFNRKLDEGEIDRIEEIRDDLYAGGAAVALMSIAQRYLDYEFQNVLMANIIGKKTLIWSIMQHQPYVQIYDQLGGQTMMSTWVIEKVVEKYNSITFTSNDAQQQFPRNMLFDICRRLFEQKEPFPTKESVESCRYYIHKDGMPDCA